MVPYYVANGLTKALNINKSVYQLFTKLLIYYRGWGYVLDSIGSCSRDALEIGDYYSRRTLPFHKFCEVACFRDFSQCGPVGPRPWTFSISRPRLRKAEEILERSSCLFRVDLDYNYKLIVVDSFQCGLVIYKQIKKIGIEDNYKSVWNGIFGDLKTIFQSDDGRRINLWVSSLRSLTGYSNNKLLTLIRCTMEKGDMLTQDEISRLLKSSKNTGKQRIDHCTTGEQWLKFWNQSVVDSGYDEYTTMLPRTKKAAGQIKNWITELGKQEGDEKPQQVVKNIIVSWQYLTRKRITSPKGFQVTVPDFPDFSFFYQNRYEIMKEIKRRHSGNAVRELEDVNRAYQLKDVYDGIDV